MTFTPLLDTRSVDEARMQVAASYCPHDLRPVGRGAGFRARHADAGTAELGVFTLDYGASAVRVDPVPFVDFSLVSQVVAGRLTVHSGGRAHHVATGEVIALDPVNEHHLDFGPGCRLVTLKLARPLLERVALAHGVGAAGRSARLRTGAPIDPRRWRSVRDFILTRALPGGLLSPEALTRRPIEEMTAAAVLAAFHTAPDAPAPDDIRPALRRAVDHIHDHADRDLTLLDLADAACVGPRTLQRLFRQELGRSPLQHLREVRLERVRAELRSDGSASVGEVAHRWGFGNLGRFAGDYRRRFGVSPSEDRR